MTHLFLITPLPLSPAIYPAKVALCLPTLKPLTPNPAVEKVQAAFWLIKRHHVPTGVKPHERKVAAALNLAGVPAAAAEFEIGQGDLVEGLLPGPLERFGPGMVAEPVADEVRVALGGEGDY